MVRLLAILMLTATLSASAMAQTTKPSQSDNIPAIEARAQLALDELGLDELGAN